MGLLLLTTPEKITTFRITLFEYNFLQNIQMKYRLAQAIRQLKFLKECSSFLVFLRETPLWSSQYLDLRTIIQLISLFPIMNRTISYPETITQLAMISAMFLHALSLVNFVHLKMANRFAQSAIPSPLQSTTY